MEQIGSSGVITVTIQDDEASRDENNIASPNGTPNETRNENEIPTPVSPVGNGTPVAPPIRSKLVASKLQQRRLVSLRKIAVVHIAASSY